MDPKQIFAKIDELYEKYVNIWEDVCNIESPTSDKEAVDECGRYFIDFAKKKGWTIETVPESVAGDVIFITMNQGAKGTPITVSGHIDTVHEKGIFGYPAVKRDDKCIYGPGVTDCKGGIVAAMLAMDALSQCGFSDRPILLLIQTDEEKGSKPSELHTINSICKKALGSTAFLNLEGMTAGEVIVGRKGIIRYKFTVSGIDVHSSRCYEGANPITEAAHKILKLEKYKDPKGLTINCGVIEGGSVPNTVAKECEFLADIRFLTEEELDFVKNLIKEVASESTIAGTSCVAKEVSFRPAMPDTPDNYRLAERMNAAFDKCSLPRLEAKIGNWGADSAYSTAYGIPSVDSVGVIGDHIHTIREFAYLDSLKESARIIAATAAYIED